jgi:restriction system protein
MHPREESIDLTPIQFEREVKAILDKVNAKIISFDSKHLEKLSGNIGEYEIDITIRFEALGVKYLTLVECKHHKNPIKREVIQILHDKIRETGAHKGIVFATTTFQRGAIEYARSHGIALIKIAEGKAFYEVRGSHTRAEPPPWANIPPYMGYSVELSDSGSLLYSTVSTRNPELLNEFLGF